ncbi:receptor-transporting protein 3 isoform X1 [Fundulus heteroclitus]|uniref:receptor-transporting protein 3 isoform X1 n=1 Tax=Fundulus heteroclitus TaxID=8078 RepID=UPI00165B063B|nr:receptor-transporting protein 3 isoform X1 [Fundulus heteroclitus]
MSRSTAAWIPAFWLDIFDELLYDDNELDYGDVWTLNFNYNQTDEVTNDQRKRGWKVYCHNAYGHFQCGSCRKTWPSARAVLLFRYRLQKGRGTVIMRPYGQACRRCQDGEFDFPGFSRKEVEHALLRLFSKIRKNCYGEDEGDEGSSTSSTKVWTKPHEKSLCEACRQGICCQEDE